MDQTIIIALALVAVWRIAVIIDINPKIKLEGKVPGKTGMMVGVAFVFAIVYLISSGLGLMQYIAAGMFFCCTLLYLPTKSGFAEDFFSFNGSKVKYEKIQHYSPVEVKGKDENDRVLMRISSTRKEMTVAFSKENAALAEAWFVKNNVPSFDAYRVAYNEAKNK